MGMSEESHLVSPKVMEIGNFVFALAVPILAGIVLLVVSPTFREIIDNMPQHWLDSIQTLRVGGFIFLVLVDMRLIPTLFVTHAGIGDPR